MTTQEKALEHYINNAKREIVWKLTHENASKINMIKIISKIKHKKANIDKYEDFLDWANKKKVESGYKPYEAQKIRVNISINMQTELKEKALQQAQKQEISLSKYINTLIENDLNENA